MENKARFNRLIIASYRLPFRFVKAKKDYMIRQNSGGLVSSILSLSENLNNTNITENNDKIVWTGVADSLPENVSGKFENEHFYIVPVPMASGLNDQYYGGFCNNMIWPLFHYFTQFSVFNNNYYKAYETANTLFCDEIIKTYQPGDFIWVHDYQLMLLPAMIRQHIPDASIGFFMHIPFPSFEIFRIMPRNWRESIINGMLGADLIGFHTHDYTQHFIKSVKRTTGFDCRQNIIHTPDNIIKVDAFPIGINYEKFHNACRDKSVKLEKQKIKNSLLNQKLIFSVDRLDYSKGLLLRLKGYETFLERFPQWRSKVVFNMVVVPSRDNIENYKTMKKEIESTVGRINGKYSSLMWRPIVYQYKSLSFNELIALYDMSDVGLVTPYRDGMNLVAKEYIASQQGHYGVLILSEMAGAAAELNEALLINPLDSIEMANAINTALEMDVDERKNRLERMQSRLVNYDVFAWAHDFFQQTYDIKEQQKIMAVKLMNTRITEQIKLEYQQTSNRVLFLDYDGTLVPFAKYPELAILDDKTLQLTKQLVADKKNHIVIISGRDREFLEKQFNEAAVTLVAEHGYFIKRPGDKWEATTDIDAQWKEIVMPIFKEYVNRCNGTFVEEKSGSLAWHYRNADSDFAQLRLNELKDNLAEIIRSKTDFEILEGNKVLEVKGGHYDKGKTATDILSNDSYDFILAAGDDNTDEFVFQAMPDSAYTIKVGIGPSYARYNVTDYKALLNLLNGLSS